MFVDIFTYTVVPFIFFGIISVSLYLVCGIWDLLVAPFMAVARPERESKKKQRLQ
jgi:ABC-type glycerol-3-phosphate transport system permease component